MNAALMTEPAHWAMGSDLGALAAIFEEVVSLAVMQRRLGPALRSSVLAQGGSGGWQAAWLGIPGETLASELAAQLPAPGQAGPLVAISTRPWWMPHLRASSSGSSRASSISRARRR